MKMIRKLFFIFITFGISCTHFPYSSEYETNKRLGQCIFEIEKKKVEISVLREFLDKK